MKGTQKFKGVDIMNNLDKNFKIFLEPLNKYWNTNKKKKWLDENFKFVSDRSWGGCWKNEKGENVATIDNYSHGKGLKINYKKIN